MHDPLVGQNIKHTHTQDCQNINYISCSVGWRNPSNFTLEYITLTVTDSKFYT